MGGGPRRQLPPWVRQPLNISPFQINHPLGLQDIRYLLSPSSFGMLHFTLLSRYDLYQWEKICSKEIKPFPQDGNQVSFPRPHFSLSFCNLMNVFT